MTTAVSSTSPLLADNLYLSSGTATGTTGSAANASEQNKRFLKLLTTQLTNQDPLNPMDNAQMTSQIAQISTVTGLEQLNHTVSGLSGQFLQLQALQGASLVGRGVVLPGKQLAVGDDGKSSGGFELSSPATQVKVELLNAAGSVVQSAELGPKAAGTGGFVLPSIGLAEGQGYTFRVTAKSGNTDLPVTSLMQDRVLAVSTSGGALKLELLRGGTVAYDTVKSVN